MDTYSVWSGNISLCTIASTHTMDTCAVHTYLPYTAFIDRCTARGTTLKYYYCPVEEEAVNEIHLEGVKLCVWEDKTN